MKKIITMDKIRGNNQWREIVQLLNVMEFAINKLEIYGVYKKHDAKVIKNAISRGWLRLHNFDEDTSQENKDFFNKHFDKQELKSKEKNE